MFLTMITKLAESGKVYVSCIISWISGAVAWMPLGTIHEWQDHTEWAIRVVAGVVAIVAGSFSALVGWRSIREGNEKKKRKQKED